MYNSIYIYIYRRFHKFGAGLVVRPMYLQKKIYIRGEETHVSNSKGKSYCMYPRIQDQRKMKSLTKERN